MDLAIENRPELEINKAQKEINSIDQRLYREQKKPQIDFIASYTSAGIGGSQNPNFSPIRFQLPCRSIPTSPACAQQQANLALLTGSPLQRCIFANRYPTFRFGVNFNLPLFGDKTARGTDSAGHRSRPNGSKPSVSRSSKGYRSRCETPCNRSEPPKPDFVSAAIARENTAKQYESEQRKLDEGQSDVYRVLERQTALAAARSNELRARTELNKAIAELERATGNSLKATISRRK